MRHPPFIGILRGSLFRSPLVPVTVTEDEPFAFPITETLRIAVSELYYSFSPTVAQWERDSPIFKEAVKISITPLITSLLIMSLSDDNEFEVIGYGVSVILLNLGMYIVAPVVAVMKIKKIFRN